MTEVKKMIGKALTTTVVATTIAWSIGLSALVAPLAASAVASGTLVKASLPAVYYVGSDMKRYVFPNEKTYKTWYADFSGVVTITDAELASMPIGGNVTYKPGIKMVKITTDPKVYAVDAHGVLRWVNSEAVATALYGASWNQMIEDVSDAFFVNYTIGSDISAASQFAPATVAGAATSINVDKNLGGFATTGALNVKLSSSQPVGGTLPLGVMGITLLNVDVTNNGTSSIIVDSLTVRRTGNGRATDWNALYVYDGNTRLTTGRTINATSNEVTVGGLNVSIAAGAYKTLTIVGDEGAAVGSEVSAFQLVSLTSGSVSATGLPVTGPSFTFTAAIAGNVAMAASGVLANIKAGETGAKMAQFQLTANVESQNVAKVTLTYNGTVTRTNISNLVLKQGGNTLATVSGINDKDQAVFVLATPFAMERGTVRTFEVYGDLNGAARAAQNIQFYLDQTADLLSVGQTYGYGVTVASTYTTVNSAVAVVDAGKLTISFNGPAASNVARRGQDKELMNFTMVAQSNLEVRRTQFQFAYTGGAVAADFTDVKLTDTATGQIVAGPYAIDAVPAPDDVVMTEVINLTAGASRTFKLTADIENTTVDGQTITVTLAAFNATAVRNLDNSTNLVPANDIVPPGAVTANPHTVRVPVLTVSQASSPVLQTYIQGTSDVSLYGLTLQAGDASDVKVSQITVNGQINDAAGVEPAAFGMATPGQNSISSIILTAKLWNGATQLGSTESPTGSNNTAGVGGVLVFDNLNLTIPAGQTVTLKMTGNLASAIANLGDTVDFTVLDANVNNVLDGWTATDPDGNAVNAAYPGVAANPATGFDGPNMTIAQQGVFSIVVAPDDTESEAGIVIGGASSAVLGKYKLTAQNEEMKLVKARFTVATPAAVASLSLYDGTALVGGPIAITGVGNADFSGLNFIIPKDGSKVLTVKGNLSTVGTGGAPSGSAATITLRDGGAADLSLGTFEVRGTGSGSSTLIQTLGVAANVAAASTYTLANSTSILAGEIFTATINGTAVNYTATVGDVAGGDAADTAAVLLGLATAIDANVTVGPIVNCVPAANAITVTAVTAGAAGNAITTVAADTSVTGTLVATNATLINGTDGDLAARIKALRKSKPTISLVSLPQATLSTGNQAVMRFSIAADAAGDVAVKHLQLNISKTTNPTLAIAGGGLSDLRRVGDSANLAGNGAITGALGAGGAAVGTLDILLTNEEVIPAGTSRQYDVRLTIGGAPVGGDNVSAALAGEAAVAGLVANVITTPGAGLVTITGDAARNFVWSDVSIVPHSDLLGGPSSADWTNGTYVKVLPTDTQTMSK